jgi:hypothetical protein
MTSHYRSINHRYTYVGTNYRTPFVSFLLTLSWTYRWYGAHKYSSPEKPFPHTQPSLPQLSISPNSQRLWNQNIHCTVHKFALLDSISCATWLQWKSVYIIDIISTFMLSSYDSLCDLFPSDFQIKILYAFCTSLRIATWRLLRMMRFPTQPNMMSVSPYSLYFLYLRLWYSHKFVPI